MTGFFNPLARKPKPGYREAVDRIKAETRSCLELSDDVTVSVTELNCREPGCPDTETIIAILSAGRSPRVARIHKAIPEVEMAELAAALCCL